MTDFDSTAEWKEPTPDEMRAIREYFDRRDDRALVDAPNPLFAGRDALIDGVAADLDGLRRAKRPLNTLTRVVYGAPGAGKSEILIQLESNFSQWDEGGSPVLSVWANSDTLADPVLFSKAVYKAAGLAPDKMAAELVRVEAGASIGVAKGSVEIRRRARESAGALERVARAITQKFGDPPTILLLVDEAQKKLVGAGGLPLDLHEANTPLKVLPVYGGLGDTVRRLRECGVSRLSSRRVHLLGPLDRDAARKMCRTGLSALADGASPHTLERWGRRIVKKTDAWPMHLAHCLRAVRDRRQERMDLPFDDTGFDQAMRAADELRADYYDGRMEACPELERFQYTAWAALFGQEGDIWPETVKAHPVLGARREEGRGDLVEGAVRAGLVESQKDGTLRSPIPSLVDYIAERGRRFERSFGQSRGSDFAR